MLKKTKNGTQPTQDEFSPYIDLYASHDVTISAGETVDVMLGVYVDLEYLHDNVDVWCGHMYRLQQNRLVNNEYDKHLEKMHNKNFNYYMSHYYLQLSLSKELQDKGLIQPSVEIVGLNFVGELKIKVNNPISELQENEIDTLCQVIWEQCKIKKGDKVARVMLLEHKTYLMGIGE